MSRFDPPLLGMYFVLVWPACCGLVFAVNMWWRRGWQINLLIYITIVVAGLALLIFVVAAVFVTDYDFRALSYTFLSINLLPMAVLAFNADLNSVAERLGHADLDHFDAALEYIEDQLRALFAEVDSDGSGHIDRTQLEMLGAKLGKNFTRTQLDSAMRELDADGDTLISFEEFSNSWWASNGDQGGGFFTSTLAPGARCLDSAKRVLTLVVAYACSVTILLAYAIVNAAIAPEENTALGFAVAFSIIFTDFLVYGMHHAQMLTAGPYYTMFLLGFTRFALVSFDKSAMFLGFCLAFIFFGATFGKAITDRRLEAEALHVEQKAPFVGTCGPCLTRVQMCLSICKALGARVCGAEAEALLLALCTAFAILTITIATVRPEGVELEPITIFDNPQPQWLFGVGSIFVVIMTNLANYARQVRVNKLWSQTNQRRLWAVLAAMYLVSAAAIVWTTNSKVLLAIFVCLPFCLGAFDVAYTLWSTNLYVVFSQPDERRVSSPPDRAPIVFNVRDTPPEGATFAARMVYHCGTCYDRLAFFCLSLLLSMRKCWDQWVNADFRKVVLPLAVLRGGATARDYTILACSIVVLGSELVFISVLSSELDPRNQYKADMLSVSILCAGSWTLAAHEWFATLQLSQSTYFLSAFAISVHTAAHAIAAISWTVEAEGDSSDSGSWGTLLEFESSNVSSVDASQSSMQRAIENWQDLHYWILFSYLGWISIGMLGLAGYRFFNDNCTITPFVLKMLALFQLPLIFGIALASYIAEKQSEGEGVTLATGLVVADASLLFVVYLVVSYGANGYAMIRRDRVITAIVLFAIVAIGIWLGLQLDGVQMFWSISVAWGAIIGVLALISAHLYHEGQQKTRGSVCYVHFSPDVLPAFMYDASEGKLISLTSAIVLRYCVGFGIMAWSIAATMFVTPTWIGSFVMALEMVEMLCYTLSARQSSIRFGRALIVLRSRIGKDQLLKIVDEARAAARTEQEQVLQDIVYSGTYEFIKYPHLEDVMVDTSGERLIGGDIVSALAAGTIGPSCDDLVNAEQKLWTATDVVTTGEYVQDLLLIDQRIALFSKLQIRYAALTRMQIEHAVAGDASSDLSHLPKDSSNNTAHFGEVGDRGAPCNVVIVPGNGSLHISWSRPETLGVPTPALVREWVVEISPGWHSISVEFNESDSGAECLCEHLTNGQQYSTTVSVVYKDGRYDRAAPVFSTPIKPSLPEPVDISIDQIGGPSTLGVSWRMPPTDFVVLRYRVTAHPGGATQEVTSTKRRVVFTAMQGIQIGVEYNFSVTAISYGDTLPSTAMTAVGLVAQASIGTEEMAFAALAEQRLESQAKSKREQASAEFATWRKEASQQHKHLQQATQRNLGWFSAAKLLNIDAARRLFAADKTVVNAVDHTGKTALHIVAANVAQPESAVMAMVEMLQSSGADISAVDIHGQNPVHVAAKSGLDFIIGHFHESVKKTKDNFGRSPKSLALMNGHTTCADLLPGDDDATEHIWRGNKTLYGLFTDAFEKDTDLEGGSTTAAITDLSAVLKRVIAHDLSLPADEVMGFHGKKDVFGFQEKISQCFSPGAVRAEQKLPLYSENQLHMLAQMLALMDDAACAPYQNNPLKLREDIESMCHEFDPRLPLTSRMICIPGGWSTPSGGHAIMYIIEATSKTTISWTTSNTGQGVGHHPASGDIAESMGDQGDANRTGQFGSITSSRIDDIDVARVDELWCCALMRQQNTTSDNNNAEVYYELLLPELLLGPLETATTADQQTDGDYAKLQRAGTCYYKCVAAAMDYLLKRLGMPKRETKHMTFALRREYLLQVDSELGYRSESFDTGDKTVISIVAHQTAAAALKERRRKWPHGEEGLSTEHMLQLHSVLTSVEDKLKSIILQQNHSKILRLALQQPSATYSRFQGFEHVISSLSMASTDRAVHHGDASDEALVLGGQSVEMEPPPTIDFRTLSVQRESFKQKDLSSAVDYLNALLNLCHAVDTRENMPARTKKLHIEAVISACFLDTLPFAGEGMWTRCTDPRVQRSALEALHRCLCVYCAACMSLPAERDAVGSRAVTAVTIFSIFEAALWNKASRDPLPLSSQLNNAKRHIPIVSYDDSQVPFHEASATMQVKRPNVMEARDAACKHLAATAAICDGNEPLYPQHPSSYVLKPEDSTLEFMKEMCNLADPCAPSRGGLGGTQFQKVTEDAPSLKGVKIPKEGMPPAQGNGPFENAVSGLKFLKLICVVFVGWLMDDGVAMKEWSWYRNAALLARLMLAAEPCVDRKTIHNETAALMKWKIVKSKWPASINSSIIVSIGGFGESEAIDFSAPITRGNASTTLYGIESSSCNRPPTEDDVLHTQRLQNFNNALNDQEAEALFATIVCPYVRVPMLFSFFDRDRLTCLCNHKIRALLEGGIFEPSYWQPEHRIQDAFDYAPVKSPAELATERGVLWNELFFSPVCTLTPLFELLDCAYNLGANQNYEGPYVPIVLFIFRVHVQVEGVYRQVLLCPTREKTPEDEELLSRLCHFRSVRARQTLAPWIDQARSAHDTFSLCRLLAHMLLSCPPLPKEDTSTDALDQQDILLLYPTMSYLNCWFPFGVESEAEEASAAGGLLNVSEVQVFAFWHRIRDRALAFVSTSSTAFTDELMNLILKTVAEGSQTAAVGWNMQSDATSVGRFEHPSGEIVIDLQTGEVFFKAGAGMKMPAEIAQAPEFKSIFGDIIPNATPLLNRQAVSCFTASHDNVRYTFESWDNKKLFGKTSPAGVGAEASLWSVAGEDKGGHFVNEPQLENSQVVYCGKRFIRSSVSKLSGTESVHPAILAAIFSEFADVFTDDHIYLQEDDAGDDEDLMLLKRLPCEPKGDRTWWIEFRCCQTRPAVDCFELMIGGRRLYRSHFFTSDHCGALNSLIPDMADRSDPPHHKPLAKPIARCAGSGFMRLQPERSVVYHRNRGRGQPAELFVRSLLLRGLIPEVLLYNFSFWYAGEDTIVGEPTNSSVQATWYNYKVHIKIFTSVAGQCGADVRRINGAGEIMTLLDLSRAPCGSLLYRLARTFEQVEPLSHVLAWTSAEPLPGETCEITILELPRLSLRFSAQFDTFDMKWRLYSLDYSDFFVSDVCIGDRDSIATQLVGLPQALILQNLNNEIRFIVPTPPPVRPKIKTVPFTTDIVLDRHSVKWLRMKRRYMIYDLHLSETMISTDTVAQTLYLVLSRILAREYELTVPLLRSLRTDVPFSSDSVRMLDLIMGIEDTHPNAVSVIFSIHQLARSNGYACKDIEVSGPMGEEQHVSAVCRPTQSTILDFVSMDARDKRVQVNCPRKHMRGGRDAGLYGYLPRAKDKVTDINIAYLGDGFACDFDHHKRYGWEQLKHQSSQEQMKTMGDLLDDSPEGRSLFAVYWMLVSGLRNTSADSAERDLLLRTVRIYIGLHLVQHGDRSIMLALLTVAWKLAERGNVPRWPFVTDTRDTVPGNYIYFWKLQESDVESGGGYWSQAGHECLTKMAIAAQSAITSTEFSWGNNDCSDSGPHLHQAFELPDYQRQPRGSPIADTIDMTSVDVSPVWMADSDASLELSPSDLMCLASPDQADPGVLGMLPISYLTGLQSAGNTEDIDPETQQPTKLSTARKLLYDAMSKPTVERKQWEEVTELFEAALQVLPSTSQTEREEAHGGLGYAYTKLGSVVEAERHLNKSLPFDLSEHQATKSRIAREMMTRVALDYQAYVKNQRESSDPFLSCLHPELLDLQLSRAEGRSSAAVNFSETIQGLRDVQKYLETVRRMDMDFMLAATQSLTAKCNKIFDMDQAATDRVEERCMFGLQRAAWYRPEITFSYLAGSILSSTMEQDLQMLNPFLTPDDVASIRTMTLGVLLRSNRASWVNITMSQVRKSIELVNETLESTLVAAGYSIEDVRLACTKHDYNWSSNEYTGVLPLAWLKEQESKLLELTTSAEVSDVDRMLHLRYCGYDCQSAFESLSDPSEVIRLQGLCKRKCCDDRAGRVRDATMVPNGEMKQMAAKAMKTNLLMLKDSTKSAAGLLNGRRCYATATGTVDYHGPLGKNIQTTKWSLDPRVVLFEYKFGFILRKRQYELTNELERAAHLGHSRCNQMIMGAGKTTVIGPLLAMMLSGSRPEGPLGKHSTGRLVIQCVPAALLAMSIDVMRSTFSTVISKDVLTLKFKRSDTDDTAAEALHQKIYSAKINKSIICTTPGPIASYILLAEDCDQQPFRTIRFCPPSADEIPVLCCLCLLARLYSVDVIKSIYLKYIELIVTSGPANAAVSLSHIIELWRSDTLLMMDEVDLLLHPLKSELNFPIGEKVPYDLSHPEGERWGLPIFLLDFCLITKAECSSADYRLVLDMFETEVQECERNLKSAIEDGYACLALQRNPHLILLSAKFYTKSLKPILCRWLGLWIEMKSTLYAKISEAAHASKVVDRNDARNFVGETDTAAVQAVGRDLQSEGVSDHFLKLLNLGRSWVLTFVPHVLSKVNRVSFGLLRESDMASMPANMSSARKQVAVPFVGKDVPSQAAEFAHPEVLIGLTILAYRYEGLRSFDVREIVSMLKQQAVREVGSYEHRKSNKLFTRWVDRAKSGLVQPDIPVNSELSLQTIQIEEPKQLEACHGLLCRLPELCYFHLQEIIFPRTMHSQINKISASGQELGSGILFAQRIGFSGTPSSLLPSELQPCHFEVASEGKIIATLCDPKLCKHTVYPKLHKSWDVKDLLKEIANGPFHALIDTGALITGLTNYEVAELLLQVGLRGMMGCVYLDDAGDKMILMRGTRSPQLLSQCGVPKDKRFTFYDQIHTTGMDIKQDLQACAAITIGKDMTLRDFAQGAWRMRGLGQGQTLHIFVVGEMEKLLSEALGSRPTAEKFAAHVVAFLVTNSCRLEQMQDGQLQVQNLGTCWRRRALEQLLDRQGGKAPSQVFIEDLDSTVPAIPPARKSLDVVLKSMKESRRVSAFLSSLGTQATDIDQAVEEIIAKAVAENVVVSSTDLDSEMESEREQEQEQEQEREQQAVAITARDKAEETPWPVKMLHDGMQASSALGLYPLADFGVPDISDGEGWTSESGPQTSLTLAKPTSISSRVFISDNVAMKTYEPQLHARRIKSVRMVVRWQDKSKIQYLGAVSLAEAAALRGRIHKTMRTRDGEAWCNNFEILLLSGQTVDCAPGFPRRVMSADAASDAFEQGRCLLRFFNSDTWFSRHENISLVKALSETPVADRALFYQGVTRCRRDAGVRWQTMPVAKAIRSANVDVLEEIERISDQVLLALQQKFGTDQAAAAKAFEQFDEDGNQMLSEDEVTAALAYLGVAASAREVRLLCESGDTDKDRKIDFSEFVNDFVHFVFEPKIDETKHRRLTNAQISNALVGGMTDEGEPQQQVHEGIARP